MDIASIGEFGLIDRITKDFLKTSASTVAGVGDDAAVIDAGDKYILTSTEIFGEGVAFDLIYTPLAHLGYKCVAAAVADIYAMNGKPTQVLVAMALSARFGVEQVDEFYSGVRFACEKYGADLAGGDFSSSLTGLTISVTAVGEVAKDKIVYRRGAQVNDLICVSGNLGAAYMGLMLLDREKRVLADVENKQPQFAGHEYILQRQLKPDVRKDIIEALEENSIVPTAMIDLSDGLASDLLQICKASGVGARIYLNRLPIAKETYAMAEELNFDPVVAALNGGEDYEMLFTVPLSMQKDVMNLGVDIIGHITAESTGVGLTTPDGQDIAITAPGWGKGEDE